VICAILTVSSGQAEVFRMKQAGERGMTGSTEGGTPEVSDSIDESAVVPSSKAHTPPLQPDCMRVQVNVPGVRVKGEVNVGRGLHGPTNYLAVCLSALATAVVVVILCRLCSASGLTTFLVSAGSAVLVLGLGLAYIVIGSKRD
jgi:hypothetical protein